MKIHIKKKIEKIETDKEWVSEITYNERLNPRKVVEKINEIIERINNDQI